MLLTFPRQVASFAVQQLANVDYTVANRVTEDIASVVSWAYEVDQPWIARLSVDLLHRFDDIGSILIVIVAWIVHHTP